MTKWLGEKKCDFCGTEESEYFVDGKTKMGPWAFMCACHFFTHGVGLGTGRGQMYNGKTFEKIAG